MNKGEIHYRNTLFLVQPGLSARLDKKIFHIKKTLRRLRVPRVFLFES
jgi:hypothetical protein